MRGFECLGACDIAPMASVNGEYVGPLDAGDVPHLIDECARPEPEASSLPAKNLRIRACADPAGQVGANPDRRRRVDDEASCSTGSTSPD